MKINSRPPFNHLLLACVSSLMLCYGSASLVAKQSNENAFLRTIDKLTEANDFGFQDLPFLNVTISQAAFSAVEQRYIAQYNTTDNNTLAWQANNDGTHMDMAGYVGIGLGSFIWYGANNHENYVEDWPSVASALQSHGVTLPAWTLGVCPWSTEAEFNTANTPGSPYYEDIQTLNKTLLTNPVALDVQFRFGPWARLLRGVTPNSDTPADYMFGYDPVNTPHAIISLPPGEAELVGANFSAVATIKDAAGNPLGLYALMDYDNFKGEGTCVTEIHNTQHWGELSVLENMGALNQQQTDPLTAFINSGLDVLHARIVNTEMENDRNNTPFVNENYSDPIKYWTFFENHLRDYGNWPANQANQ